MPRPKPAIPRKTVYTRVPVNIWDHLEEAFEKYSERQPITKQNFYNACIERGLSLVEADIQDLPKLI